jgi:hypothetical protein
MTAWPLPRNATFQITAGICTLEAGETEGAGYGLWRVSTQGENLPVSTATKHGLSAVESNRESRAFHARMGRGRLRLSAA